MRRGLKGAEHLFSDSYISRAPELEAAGAQPKAVPDTSEAAQQPAEAILSCKQQACSAAANAGGGAALAVSGSLRAAKTQNIASVNGARTMTAKGGQG